MSYAKQLFTAPMAMLAQAAGAASMPFFASLWTAAAPLRIRHRRGRLGFARGLAGAAGRLRHGGAWPCRSSIWSLPAADSRPADARVCAAYFAIFSVSLFLWSAQAIYARAFYAAGNTFVPMVAGTIVTAVSLPIYAALYNTAWRHGAGHRLRLGIAMQTLLIAVLLHKRRMVSLASLDYAEMGRCLLTALIAGAAAWLLGLGLSSTFGHLPGAPLAHHARLADAAVLIAGCAVWILIAKLVLEKAGSALPRVTMRRLGIG